MSTLKNISLADYVDVLNSKALEINKYEGFFPARYLIEDNNAKEMTLKIIPTSGEESAIPDYEIKISKLSPYDRNWFEHAAEAQIAVYQSVIDVLLEINKKDKLFKEQNDGKFAFVNKKARNNKIVQQELELIELSSFRSLAAFRNYSIADIVKPKKEETIESIKDKTSSLVESIRDSIARLRFIDNTPNFNMIAVIKEESLQLTVSLNNEKIITFTNNWKTIKEDQAYDRLVSLCYVSRAVLNTLQFYQYIIGITEPRLFVSKVFSKKWKITDAGEQYLTCLEVSNLVKEIFGFGKAK